MRIPESEWKWFGRAGHFICGQWCRFHLCTQVGPYLISSVGAYVHPRHGNGSERAEGEWLQENWPGEDIGYGRKFETMVFMAGDPCTAPECGCGSPDHDGRELDSAGSNDFGTATANHMAMCRKWADKGGDHGSERGTRRE